VVYSPGRSGRSAWPMTEPGCASPGPEDEKKPARPPLLRAAGRLRPGLDAGCGLAAPALARRAARGTGPAVRAASGGGAAVPELVAVLRRADPGGAAFHLRGALLGRRGTGVAGPAAGAEGEPVRLAGRRLCGLGRPELVLVGLAVRDPGLLPARAAVLLPRRRGGRALRRAPAVGHSGGGVRRLGVRRGVAPGVGIRRDGGAAPEAARCAGRGASGADRGAPGRVRAGGAGDAGGGGCGLPVGEGGDSPRGGAPAGARRAGRGGAARPGRRRPRRRIPRHPRRMAHAAPKGVLGGADFFRQRELQLPHHGDGRARSARLHVLAMPAAASGRGRAGGRGGVRGPDGAAPRTGPDHQLPGGGCGLRVRLRGGALPGGADSGGAERPCLRALPGAGEEEAPHRAGAGGAGHDGGARGAPFGSAEAEGAGARSLAALDGAPAGHILACGERYVHGQAPGGLGHGELPCGVSTLQAAPGGPAPLHALGEADASAQRVHPPGGGAGHGGAAVVPGGNHVRAGGLLSAAPGCRSEAAPGRLRALVGRGGLSGAGRVRQGADGLDRRGELLDIARRGGLGVGRWSSRRRGRSFWPRAS